MGVPKCLQMSHRTSFISMIVLTLTFFFVEIIVGYATNSMALVADSFHMLSDVVSLFVGYIALRYSTGGKQSSRYTFGWARAEVLGALVNAVFLVALCFSIFVEALKRIILPEAIEQPKLVLVTGAIGLFVNLIGLFLFHQTGHGHSHGGGSHSHSHGGGHSHNHGDAKKKSKKNKHSHSHGASSQQQPNGHTNSKNCADDLTVAPLLTGDHNEVFAENADASEDKQLSMCQDTTATASKSGSSSHSEFETSSTPLSTEVDEAVKPSNQLNIRGVYLHVLGDALGSVIVMVSALIILYADGKWTVYVDPAMSIILVFIILKTSVPLLKESSMILMQTVPTHLKIQEMQDKLIDQIPGVVSVHEFHVWQLAGSKIIASAHVKCETLADYMAIANQLKEFFHNEGIHSTTIQPEFIEKPQIMGNGGEDVDGGNGSATTAALTMKDCILECAPNCAERMCCTTNVTATPPTGTGGVVGKEVAVDIDRVVVPLESELLSPTDGASVTA